MGLDFIARSAPMDDVSRVIADFRAIAGASGFEGAFCGAWAAGSHRLFFSDWPQDALDPLLQSEQFRNELDEARRRLMPFTWADASSHRATAGIAVHPAVRAQGWVDGLIVPMHGPSGYLGLAVLASRRRVDAPLPDRAALHVVALTLHEACRSAATAPSPASLTRRERECLRWVAAGKSDRDIAALLGVSASTAHYHVERVKKKLGVNSRSHAVAVLLLEGEL
jgi:LuxR family quorum sensing-dependent transcriptional regulator